MVPLLKLSNSNGPYVTEVKYDSPAHQAGLLKEDIVPDLMAIRLMRQNVSPDDYELQIHSANDVVLQSNRRKQL